MSQRPASVSRPALAYRELLGGLVGNAALSDLAELAAGWALELLGADGASVSCVSGTELEYLASLGERVPRPGTRVPLAGSATGRVIATGAAELFDPETASPNSLARARTCGIASGLVAPIHLDGRVAGTVGVTSGKTKHFGEAELGVLRTLAGYVSLGLERARIREEVAHADRLACLGELTSYLGHEVKNPLAWIGTNVDWLRGEVARKPEVGAAITDIGEALDEMAEGVRRIMAIVEDLGVFSRGAEPRIAERVEVAEELRMAASIAGARVREVARLELELESGAEVMSRPGVLTQMCVNLLLNAAAAIPADDGGTHTIRVALSVTPTEVRILVEDSGVGMDAGTQARVFEPFFTTRERRKGTGLGLAQVWRSVTELGGRVEIDSSPGQGAAFTVHLNPAG